MTEPSVSICIPAYGAEPFFRRTLESVLTQDFDALEVIVTDDSPDDRLQHVIADLSDPRIRYHRNADRLGSPANWNATLALVRSPLVKMMHHDDWFTDNTSLGRLVELMDAHPEVSFGFCGAWVCDANGRQMHQHTPPADRLEQLRRNPAALFIANFIGSPSETIWRHEPAVRFDERMKWLVDVDFYMHWQVRQPGFAHDPAPLVSNTWGAAHQVTNECTDRALLLREWTTLYQKLSARGLMGSEHRRHMAALYRDHHVTRIDELYDLGVPPPLPMPLRRAIWTNRLRHSLKPDRVHA